MSKRIGEASQFFSGQDEDEKPGALQATTEKVVELLNQIQLASPENKVSFLKQIQELIVNKDPTLLDNFLDEILIYQQDRSSDVRKFVVVFIEEACKKDPELLPKTIGCLTYMLTDENTTVMKRVMLACNSLYKTALQLVCKLRTIKQDIQDMWESMTELKRHICGMIESENDGVRTHAIKFMEMLILVHSKQPENSEQPKKEGDLSIDIVPSNHPLVKYNDLVNEGMTTMEALLALCGSPNISSVNLMAVLSSLTSIGKQRPIFLSTVVQAFELLHANLPPTLSKSQVSSVRKNIKMQLFALIKLPAADTYVTQIGTLLTDLGATPAEIQKSLPKVSETRKRRAEDDVRQAKKSKKDEKADGGSGQFSLSKAIELTTADIVPRLTKEAVTDLVLVSMLFLPRTMPSQFQETFTPIAAAGSSSQSEHLGRLMATQMTNAGIGVGIERAKEIALNEAKAPKEIKKESSSSTVVTSTDSKSQNVNIKPRSIRDIAAELKTGAKTSQDNSGSRLRKIKPFKLQDAAKRLTSKEIKDLLHITYRRILKSDKQAVVAGSTVERYKIIVGLAMQFYGDLTQVLIDFVMEDFRSRIDLGILWLYQEYVKTESNQLGSSLSSNSQYALCLKSLVAGIKDSLEPRDKLFTRFILEAPALPDSIRKTIKEYCMDSDRIMVGFATLRELISKSPAKCNRWLQLLLELTTAEKEQVRVQAIHSAKKLHSHPDFTELIEDFAKHSLQQLLLEVPPTQERNQDDQSMEDSNEWTEESIKAFLYLYLALLPSNHSLFLNLADVYVDSSPIIKRTILRHLEHPVRAIGMNSPELLQLVEKCPAGAETLVTRVLHIVTDKNPPSNELVQRVKDLYQKRVSDVRFLIPVLNGLMKHEIIDALPQLITQSPNVVKEVFNRLLGSFQSGTAIQNLPLSPSELLVALHTIESKSDVKAIMKAINICFGEKEIYTQEVLAVVIQQLIDITPLPTLFMRTVIQSLGMCPRLVGFVMNILSKLISKQVWKYSKVWQGFVKCCQMTKPQSFPILLQLPPKQLDNVFKISPELKPLLVTHIESMSANQRAHIPKTLLQILQSESNDTATPSSSAGAYSSATFSTTHATSSTTSDDKTERTEKGES